MSDNVTPLHEARSFVLTEVAQERARQDDLWGEQNHPDGTGEDCPYQWRGMAVLAQLKANRAAEAGLLTWRDVLMEEFAEAMEAPTDELLREELIQVAAVAAAWVEAIDRRPL